MAGDSTCSGTLSVDTITPRIGVNEVSITGDLAVSRDLLVDALRTSTADTITVPDNMAIGGTLTVASTNILDSLNPYWVSVIINDPGGTPTIIRNAGRNAATSVARVSAGLVQFDFPAHPQGAAYVVSTASVSCYASISAKTSTKLTLLMGETTATAYVVEREIHVNISVY